jgi:hypothetical protein
MTTIRVPAHRPFAVGDYPAGSEAWASTPRQIALSTAERADGFTPDDPFPAEEANSLESEKVDALGVLHHGAMRDWREYSPVITTETAVADAICGMTYKYASAPVVWAHKFIVTGGETSGSKGFLSVSSNGMSPFKKALPSNNGPYSDVMAGEEQGIAFGLLVTPSVGVDYTDTSGSWTAAVSAGGGSVLGMFAALGKYWFVTTTAVRSAANLAALLAPTLVTHADAALTDIAFSDAAWNGGAILCIAGRNSLSNVTIAYSADSGATFSTGHDFGDHEVSLTYSAALSLFIAWVDDGSIWTSGDGATWAQETNTAVATTARGAIEGPNTFAACGSVIAKLWQLSPSVSDPTGIAWSDDLGATWHVRALSHFTQVKQIKTIDGRFWVVDGVRVYHSGRLEALTDSDQ